MKFSLKISPLAQSDIDGIYDYIFKDSPKSAKEQIESIYNALDNIERFPEIGADLKGYVSIETDYKYFIVKNCKILNIQPNIINIKILINSAVTSSSISLK